MTVADTPATPAAPATPRVLKNPQAVALYIGFQNALHDLAHAGFLSHEVTHALIAQATSDTYDLLKKGAVAFRGHGEEKITMTEDMAFKVDNLIANLVVEVDASLAMSGANYIPQTDGKAN